MTEQDFNKDLDNKECIEEEIEEEYYEEPENMKTEILKKVSFFRAFLSMKKDYQL